MREYVWVLFQQRTEIARVFLSPSPSAGELISQLKRFIDGETIFELSGGTLLSQGGVLA